MTGAPDPEGAEVYASVDYTAAAGWTATLRVWQPGGWTIGEPLPFDVFFETGVVVMDVFMEKINVSEGDIIAWKVFTQELANPINSDITPDIGWVIMDTTPVFPPPSMEGDFCFPSLSP